MGCASSSPTLVPGGGPGGLVDNAKTVANDVMSSSENAMNGKQNSWINMLFFCAIVSHTILEGSVHTQNRENNLREMNWVSNKFSVPLARLVGHWLGEEEKSMNAWKWAPVFTCNIKSIGHNKSWGSSEDSFHDRHEKFSNANSLNKENKTNSGLCWIIEQFHFFFFSQK